MTNKNLRGIEPIGNKFSLDDLDKRIIDLKTKYPQLQHKELAETLSIDLNYLTTRMLRPAFQRAMQEYNKDLFSLVGELQIQAVRRLKQLVNDPDKDIAIAAIKIAMAPMTNQHTLNINNSQNDKVYEVRFGDSGQLIKGFKSTKELIDTIDVTSSDKPS
jgi:hypothetical protein